MMDVADMKTGLYVAGEWVDGSAGTFVKVDPATGEELVHIASASAEDVDRAVAAARQAFRGDWGAVPPSAKGALLNRLADLVERDADQLVRLRAAGVPDDLIQVGSGQEPG